MNRVAQIETAQLPHAQEGAARGRREAPAAAVRMSSGRMRGERDGPDCTTREGPASPAPEWTAVCRLEDIVPNTGVCALVGGRQVAIFRLDDDHVHALENYDPFSRANVMSRGIVGDVKGELVVASPVYKQHFSLISGQCLEDPGVRIPVLAARVEDNLVWVSTLHEQSIKTSL